MKKINTIDYGGKVIGIGLVFLTAIPAALYGLNLFLCARAIRVLIRLSLGIGALIEAGFACVLFLELRQDRIIQKYYTNAPSSEKTPQQILDGRRWRGAYPGEKGGRKRT